MSERELEILRLVATGAANKEIALRLQISANTVKVHLRNIFSKIGVASRTEATLYALSHNLVDGAPNRSDGRNKIESEASAPAAPARKVSPRLWLAGAVMLIASAAALVMALWNPLQAPAQVTTTSAGIQRWFGLAEPPLELEGARAVAHEGLLYVFNGSSDQKASAKALEYHIDDDRWVYLPDRPQALSGFGAARIGGTIFLAGGIDAAGKLQATLAGYQISERKWQTYAPMPVALQGAAVVAVEGKLYVLGGVGEAGWLDTLLIYQPDSNSWSKGMPLPAPRAWAAAVAQEGRVRLIGGENASGPLREVLDYIPGNGLYKEGPQLPQARVRAGAVDVANLVLLFGGTGEPMPALGVEANASEWFPLDPALYALPQAPAVAMLGNFVHVLGGRTHQMYQAVYTITIPFSSSP